MVSKKKKHESTANKPAAVPFHSPFAALKDRFSDLPPADCSPQPRQTPETKRSATVLPAKAVVRMERKGRCGKEVTVVEQLDLSHEKRERWLKELKQSLGCGGTIEDSAIVLQGDHRERLRALLVQMGVRKVLVGTC